VNILYLAHRIPYPPNKGDKIRSFHQVKYLSKKHNVHLACFIDDKEDFRQTDDLAKLCRSLDVVYRGKILAGARYLAALPTHLPLSVSAFRSAEMRKKIQNRMRSTKMDVIIIYSSSMAPYARLDESVPKVIDFVDVDSEKWREYANYKSFPLSWIYRCEAGRLANHEKNVAEQFDHSLFTTEVEANILRSWVPSCSISVAPNGVDLEYFSSSFHAPDQRYSNIVFTGAMDYFPNVDAVKYFVQKVLPIVVKAVPSTRFCIVGRNPAKAVRRLARPDKVMVTGAVPDIRPFLRAACVAVAPLRIARGVQNKILEAMAMGIPVVCSKEAGKGVPWTREGGVIVADSPMQYAEEIIKLMTNPDYQRDCSCGARRSVEESSNWERHGELVEARLQGVVQGGGNFKLTEMGMRGMSE
jgi:polysaccharide biosynthesis protein PslH